MRGGIILSCESMSLPGFVQSKLKEIEDFLDERWRLSDGSRKVVGEVMKMVRELVEFEESEIRAMVKDVIDAYEELFIFHTINETLASLLDENEVSRVVLEKAVSIVKARRASVMLLDETGEKMRIVHARGIPDQIVRSVEVRVGDPYAGWVLEKRKPLLVEDIDRLPENLKLPSRGKYSSRSFLIVPILARDMKGEDTPLGVINLADREDGVFTAGDLKLVLALARAAGAFILNTRLMKEMRKNEILRHELEIAASIQRSMLPSGYYRDRRFEIAGFCQPAGYVGGDYFDYTVDENGVRAIIGDVSGHGLGAALYMSTFRSFFRALKETEIHEIFDVLNRLLLEDSGEMFVTSALAEVENGVLRVSVAGHPPPIVFRNGRAEVLKRGGLPLGVFENIDSSVEEMELEGGNFVLLYTDGLVDVKGKNGERFGTDRLVELIERNWNKDLKEITDVIKDSVMEFSEGVLDDDLTFLMVRIL